MTNDEQKKILLELEAVANRLGQEFLPFLESAHTGAVFIFSLKLIKSIYGACTTDQEKAALIVDVDREIQKLKSELATELRKKSN